jgi:O2-independent ubiquinone biosynthesis accessory factor UbiT
MSDMYANASVPPFSPMLLVSLALKPVPAKLFAPLVAHIQNRIIQLYPGIFERLEPLGICCFHIQPTDFHYRFVVLLDHGQAHIVIDDTDHDCTPADATISGSLLSLISLLEGRVDGDALFFSRDLTVEGDTEAVLTLRNAVDSADISLEDIFLEYAGPLKPLLAKGATRASSLFGAAWRDFDLLRRSIINPLPRRIHDLEDDLERQENQVSKLEKEIRKLKAARKRNLAPSENN